MIDKDLGAAAGDIFTTQIAKAIQAKTGGNVEGKIPEWWAEFIGMVLAELQSAGRLIPAGGMALTAEQVEDVRTVANCALQYGNIASREAASRLDSSLPATEPAEEVKPIGWYRTMTPKFATEYFGFPDGSVLGQTHTASDGGTWGWCGDDWELLVYPPDPAEPAEEVTQAEEKLVAHRDSKGDIYVGHALVAFKHRSYEQIRRWFNEAHPGGISERRYRAVLHLLNVEASSPVVPAPTETGPWQHRVNGEICVASPASGLPYTIGKFNDHGDFVWHSSSAELPEGFAPFVAAEEG